ncbi:MAG: zinc-ribbon domain-containing protein [Chloroflexota bacterium]
MRCPSCNFENREGVKFCESCGAALPAVVFSAPPAVQTAVQVCPVCGTQNRAGARFCGKCGTTFLVAQRPSIVTTPGRDAGRKSSVLGIVFGILALGVLIIIGFGAFIVLGGMDYFSPVQPVQPTQPPIVIYVTATPQAGNQQPAAPQPSPTRSPTRNPESTLPPSTKTVNRCGLFEGIEMKVIYLDWISGAPLQFYVKMPGGVPGLEKKIGSDSQPWNYSVKIGDVATDDCRFIEGYKERLYCSIDLPSGYANSARTFDLSVNGCTSPIYHTGWTDIPAYAGGTSSNSCGDAPSNTDLTAFQAWCSCMGGAYSVFYPAGELPQGFCLIP